MALRDHPHASLLGLPQELIDMIVFKTVEDGDKSDLFDISRTCSALRTASLPLIYERFRCSPNNFDEEELLELFTKSPFATDVGKHAKILEMQFLDPWDDTLYRLLECTKNLKSLYLHYCLKYDDDGKGCCVDTRRLSKALRHVGHSLVEMRIHYRFGNRLNETKEWPESDLKHHAMDLRQLVALRALTIPTSILLGWRPEEAPMLGSILPPNLTTLTFIRDHSFNYARFLANLKSFETLLLDFSRNQRLAQWTPRLESICVQNGYWLETKKDWEGRTDVIRRILEENGLKYIESRVGLIDWSTHTMYEQ
ncbi:hypothetical protein FB567DRAFT_157687 [Paraphoma chrysanthemicola]|uniref:Uncharacterized protein n=1 Tax=Paraphoma chrysanthemicola TaxID=798071 RepID=A0A8K0VUW1_9PLEO|nr:hypothetical protein FB567DRAFT_157687 [Paraphoma chrysanthemicola]